MIKSIRTTYRGIKFRSQLEARWAVYLDILGVKWQYEPQAFNLPGVGGYLPDFKLIGTHGTVFAEVKPTRESDLAKPFALSKMGHVVVLLIGLPGSDQECYLSGGLRESCTLTNDARYNPVYHPQKITQGGTTIFNRHVPDTANVATRSARAATFERTGATT